MACVWSGGRWKQSRLNKTGKSRTIEYWVSNGQPHHRKQTSKMLKKIKPLHLVTSAWLFSLMGTDQQDGCKLLIRCKAGPGRKLMALRRVANNIKEKSRSIDGHDLIAKCTPDLKSCNSCLSVGNSDFLSCFHRWCYVSRYSKKTQAAACKHVYVYTHAVMDFSCSSDHVQNREISHIYCSLIFVVCVAVNVCAVSS